MMEKLLQLQGVLKRYGDNEAVKDVSFDVHAGEIFGLIGPDGAGKTSLMRMVVSLLRADKGRIVFLGRDVLGNNRFVRSRIGYMPQRFSLYQDLSVEENLLFFGNLFNVPKDDQQKRLKELYEFSRLGPFSSRRAGNLSGGMKQKLALSCMLMHKPRVMVLDEPTFGVDPVSRREFWDILGTLRDEGVALLVSTPYMDEAGRCDRIALMHNGRLLACDTPAAVVADFPYTLFSLESPEPHALYNALSAGIEPGTLQLFAGGVVLVDRDGIGQEKLSAKIEKLTADKPTVNKVAPQLENIFLDRMRYDG